MKKLNWLVGTLAATVVILGTAFGIHSVQAADSESKAASDMVFEEEGSYYSVYMNAGDQVWLADTEEEKTFTVVDNDGSVYHVDNTDGKYGEIFWLSGLSVGKHIPVQSGNGVKFYNFDGSEAFGGVTFDTPAQAVTVGGVEYIAVYNYSTKQYTYYDADGKNVATRIDADGKEVTSVGIANNDNSYFYATCDMDEYVYDGNLNRVGIIHTDGSQMTEISKAGDYYDGMFEYSVDGVTYTKSYVYDSSFNRVDLFGLDGYTLVSFSKIDDYYLALYSYEKDSNVYYKEYIYDNNFNITDKGQVDGYRMRFLNWGYDNYYLVEYESETEENANSWFRYKKWYYKDFTPFSSQQPLSYKSDEKIVDPSVYSQVIQTVSQFNIGTYGNVALENGYTLYDEGIAERHNTGYIAGYKVYIGMKEYENRECDFALFDENGKIITELGKVKNSYSFDMSLTRGDRIVYAGKIIKVSRKSQDTTSFNGLCQDENGNWNYYVNGAVDNTYTGLAANEFGWFYVSNGTVDWSYTGLANNEYGWFYVSGGVLDWSYTGLAGNEYGWFYVSNGTVDWGYTGLSANEYGWFYVSNGTVDWGYTGLSSNEYGWFYVNNGALDWSYTGLAANEYGWFYVSNGALDWGYTGLAANEYGWFYVGNGVLDWSYTGLANNENGWFYISNGMLDWNYTGTATNEYGTWNVVNGQVVF